MDTNTSEGSPSAINRGVVALWVSAIWYFVAANVTTRISLPAALLPSTNAAGLLQGVAILMMVVVIAIMLTLTWLVVRGIDRRHGWARIVVLAAFLILLPFRWFWFVSKGEVDWTCFGALVHLGLDCYIIVTLFGRDGRIWFSGKPIPMTEIDASGPDGFSDDTAAKPPKGSSP